MTDAPCGAALAPRAQQDRQAADNQEEWPQLTNRPAKEKSAGNRGKHEAANDRTGDSAGPLITSATI